MQHLVPNRALHSSAVLRSLTLLPDVFETPQHLYGERRLGFWGLLLFCFFQCFPGTSFRSQRWAAKVPDPLGEEFPTRLSEGSECF